MFVCLFFSSYAQRELSKENNQVFKYDFVEYTDLSSCDNLLILYTASFSPKFCAHNFSKPITCNLNYIYFEIFVTSGPNLGLIL